MLKLIKKGTTVEQVERALQLTRKTGIRSLKKFMS
jgi:hypothetical protein